MRDSVLSVHQLETTSVPSPVPYSVLHPNSPVDGLPLVLFLHGGGGSNDFLQSMQPVFDSAWSTGALPPCAVVTPAAQRSFYLDRFDGSQLWETLVADELIAHVVGDLKLDGDRVVLSGISMGGLGSLRMAFRHPDRYVAVAALEPALEEATEWDDVLPRDRVYRDDELIEELFGGPVDADHFRTNHPRHLAEINGPAIAASGMAIYIECGDSDLLHLQYGAEALHRQLFSHGIDHEFRLVLGGNHLGPSLPDRFDDAIGFIGRRLRSPAGYGTDAMLDGFGQMTDQLATDSGYRRREVIDGPAGQLEVLIHGDGPAVVCIPSLGRGARDFDALASRLARSGYRAICPEPRGFGRSTSPLENLSMEAMADDIAAVTKTFGDGPATVVGHAFGNRVARMTATCHPDLVESVVLLACGGKIAAAPEHMAALRAVFDVELDDTAHLEAVDTVFFAPGNDASVWFDGWDGLVADAQSAATLNTPIEEWWTAGDADVLVIQPADDVIAVPANAVDIVESLGERANLITIDNAGHALLPEQPAAVATALLTWLVRRDRNGARS